MFIAAQFTAEKNLKTKLMLINKPVKNIYKSTL